MNDKKFFEFARISGKPIVNEVTLPECPMGEDGIDVFLVYAEDEKKAFDLAMDHIFDGKPLEKFYGVYKGESYHGDVVCVM